MSFKCLLRAAWALMLLSMIQIIFALDSSVHWAQRFEGNSTAWQTYFSTTGQHTPWTISCAPLNLASLSSLTRSFRGVWTQYHRHPRRHPAVRRYLLRTSRHRDLLLQHGARCSADDLNCAARHVYFDVVQASLGLDTKSTYDCISGAFRDTVVAKHGDINFFLLQHGATCSEHDTLLHLGEKCTAGDLVNTASHGLDEAVRFIVEKGVDVNAVNANG
jgi:hypothetical protein